MKIKTYLNCTEQEIQSKKFNIFIGISLGSKYFIKDTIKKYILWALENTKDDVLVLIADKNHAINYEVLKGYSSERALQVALKKGLEIEESVKKIVRGLPKEKHHLIKICKWEDARKSSYYQDKMKIFLNEIQENSKFHNFIIKIVQENLGGKAENLNLEQLDKLSLGCSPDSMRSRPRYPVGTPFTSSSSGDSCISENFSYREFKTSRICTNLSLM